MNKFISIIIPVYNEVESIKELYTEIIKVVHIYNKYEIIFINDGSSDNSVGKIRKIATGDNCVKLVRFYKNFGKADALSEGFINSRGDYIITMDADLQDDPAEIPNLINKLDDG